MKLGAQEKKKVIIMAVLLVIAVPLAIYNFSSVFGSTSAAPAPVAPAAATAGAGVSHASPKRRGIPQVREKSLDPSLRTDILAASQKIQYNEGKRNIFRMEEAAPVAIDKPNASVRQTPPQQQIVINQPALPPQIPLKYYGFSNRPGEAKKAFLQDGENIFVAVEGDVVERRYKIVKITNNSVLVEDVLNNNQQNITITPPQASSGT